MDCEHKEDGELHPSAIFIFLFERGTLGDERALRTLVIHFILDCC